MPTDGVPPFVAEALRHQGQIDRLLAEWESRPRWPPFPRRRDRELSDPELHKNLRIFRRLIDGAIGLHQRGWIPDARLGELLERVALPHDRPLTVKTLLDRRFELEHLLIKLGDRDYLASRVADLYDEERGTHSTWRTLFGDQLPALLPGPVPAAGEAAGAQRDGADEEVEPTRRRLERLICVKQSEDQMFKARWELKQRAAYLVTWVLGVAAVVFGVAVAGVVPNDRELLAAVAAGASGAALGGLIRLRDQVSLGAQVRQFRPFFLGQVVVGATAGLATFLTDAARIVSVSGEATGVIVAAFAIGFSEAAFVGLLDRIAAAAGGSGS